MAITPLSATIDLNPSYKVNTVVYVSQLDNNLRQIAFTIQDGGVNYDVAASGYDVYIEGTKPDNRGFSYKVTDIGGTVSGSVVTVPIQTQMTAVQGLVSTEIVLKSGANRIGSANFILMVERAGLADDIDVSETDIPGYINGAQQAAAAAAQSAEDAEDAKDTAVNAATTAQNVLDSIPEDYSQMSDDLSAVKSAIGGLIALGTLVPQKYIKNTDGTEGYDANWSCTNYINIESRLTIVIESPSNAGTYNAFYKTDKTFISAFAVVSGKNVIPVPSDAAFARLSNKTADIQATKIYSDIGLLSNKVNMIETDALLRTLAEKNGYYACIPLEWESGSIVTPSGVNKNPDVNVIRTPLPRMQLNGDISFVLLNDKYKIRLFGFTSESSQITDDSGWVRYAGEYIQTVDTNKYYRIQITTDTASSMDVDDALNSILIVYADNTKSDIDYYWNTYIDTKASTINEYMKDGTDKTAFLFVTDTHWNENTEMLNHYGINTALMKYIANECNIQYIIHGGDLNSEFRSNKDTARKLMTIPMSMMRDASEHVLVTRGNHDDNNESGMRNWSYTISQSDSYSYMFRNTKNVVFGETGTYFYHDIPFEKVRIISLDCVDFPYTNSNDSSQLDEKLLAYGHTQMQWFCDVLASTPSGYHVVIYTHAMLAPSVVTIDHPSDSPQTRAQNYLVPVNILKAYKNRQNYTETMSGSFSTYHSAYYTGTLAKDFSACDATIVGVFSGHEHIDCIEEIIDGNGNGIGIYNTCTQNSSNPFASSVISASYQHPMTIGTTSELVWDVVVIDRKNKHVDMIRIGANGANTDMDEVNVRSFNY